jgi:putative ABC transport system substrate-binding protein
MKSKKAKKITKNTNAIMRIGFLHSGSEQRFTTAYGALLGALPTGVDVDAKWAADAGSDIEGNLRYFAEGLVEDSKGSGEDRIRVIVAAGGPGPARLLRELTEQSLKPPVVFTTVVDPKKMGLVKSLKKPGYNLTGMAGQTSELDPERLQILFNYGPAGINRGDKIGVLVAKNRFDKDDQHKKVKDKADGPNLRLILRRRDATDLQEIETAFRLFKIERVKGVVVSADSLFNNLREEVVAYANASGIPTIYQWKEFVDVKGLISHGPDIIEAYRTAGEYVTRILGGEDPAEMECSHPSPPKTYVNAATASGLGLKVPSKILGSPVRVI